MYFNSVDFKNIDIVHGILLTFQHTKNVKVLAAAVGSCQKLITHQAIYNKVGSNLQSISPDQSISDILGHILDSFLKVISLSADIQLKILQSILPLASNFEMLHKENLVKVFHLCFQLLSPNSDSSSSMNMIRNSAEATLRQLIIIIFDKAEKAVRLIESEKAVREASRGDSLKTVPSVLDAYSIFKDLCYIIQGDNGPFLGSSSLNIDIALELIESIIACHPNIVEISPDILDLLSTNLVNSLEKLASTEFNIFPTMLRILRIYSVFVKQFVTLEASCRNASRKYIYATFSYIEANKSTDFKWQAIVSLEIWRSFIADENILRSIFEFGIFPEFIALLEHLQENLEIVKPISLSDPLLKQPLIDNLEKSNAPSLGAKSSNYSNSYINLLIFQCVLSLCRAQPFLAEFTPRLERITLNYFPMIMEQCNRGEGNEEDILLTVKGYLVFGLKNLGMAASVTRNSQSKLFTSWYLMNKDALDLALKTDVLAFSSDTIVIQSLGRSGTSTSKRKFSFPFVCQDGS